MDGKEGEWCMKIECAKVIVFVVERVWHHKYTRVFVSEIGGCLQIYSSG